MSFLPSSYVPCEDCGGQRYNPQTLEVLYNEKSIGDVMEMTIEQAAEFFATNQKIARPLSLLVDTGLGYLKLGQPSPTLSGGEAQRLKLATELTRGIGRAQNERIRKMRKPKSTLYLLEEPTIGLHMADVELLLNVLHRLVDEGNTVIVIEHNLSVIAEADYIVDIGPEAGEDGGEIVATGTPEQVAKNRISRTAPFLREVLSGNGGTPALESAPRIGCSTREACCDNARITCSRITCTISIRSSFMSRKLSARVGTAWPMSWRSFAAIALLAWLSKKGYADIHQAQVGDFITWAALFGVMIGGRLGYVFFYKPEMLREPLSILRVWEGGMSAHGGIIGLVLFTLYYARKYKMSWTNLGDNLCVVAPIGLFFGRCANFINGELYGRAANFPWAMQFPKELLETNNPELVNRAVALAQPIDPLLTGPDEILRAVPTNPRIAEMLRTILDAASSIAALRSISRRLRFVFDFVVRAHSHAHAERCHHRLVPGHLRDLPDHRGKFSRTGCVAHRTIHAWTIFFLLPDRAWIRHSSSSQSDTDRSIRGS